MHIKKNYYFHLQIANGYLRIKHKILSKIIKSKTELPTKKGIMLIIIITRFFIWSGWRILLIYLIFAVCFILLLLQKFLIQYSERG